MSPKPTPVRRRNALVFLTLCALLSLGSACSTTHVRVDTLQEIQTHPEFPAAVRAAPNLIKLWGDRTIELELELERR